MNEFEIVRLTGSEAREHITEIAFLRLKIFSDFPYLYEGTLDYEIKYLETYFSAKNSIILMVKDRSNNRWIGVTTGIWAVEEEESFKTPFIKYGIDPKEVFYFGESIVLKEYRGRGLGRVFFEERERFAKTIPGIRFLSFCAVVRNNHPKMPEGYTSLDNFWKSQGFIETPGLTTTYDWRDVDEDYSTEKNMQFWLKKI